MKSKMKQRVWTAMETLSLILFVYLIGIGTCVAVAQTPSQEKQIGIDYEEKVREIKEVENRLRIEKLPAQNVLFRTYTGDYKGHTSAIPSFLEYTKEHYEVNGPLTGIYPVDPDSAEDSNLRWELAIRISPKKSTLFAPEKAFQIKTLSPIQAVTLKSTVANSHKDGLSLKAWILLNGYIANGATRMEFSLQDGEPLKTPVKIIIPVKKRSDVWHSTADIE